MASIAEMFRKIRIAPTFDLNRQNWVVSTMYNGWVWDDSRGDWKITVSSITYFGQELSRGEWYNKQNQWAIENPKNEVTYKRTGIYELRYDAERNAYYFFDTLGRKIYEDVSSQDASADFFIGKTINEIPNYSFDEYITDILGNAIQPKKPEVGLFDTKSYFDLLTRTRQQYKDFWIAKTDTERIKFLEERATDIVSEEARIFNLLSIAQKAKTTDKLIINTISLVASIFGGGGGKISGVSIQTAVRFAQSQTTDKRIQLLGEELKYIDAEYTAIKAYFDERNAKLANITASSGVGKWLVQNWGWIIAASVSIGTFIYVYRKKNKRK